MFVGARVQRGHGLGSLSGWLIRGAVPLIKRVALAFGKGALKTGFGVTGEVLSGQKIKPERTRSAVCLEGVAECHWTHAMLTAL